ncbi:hypothetical protein HMI56_002721 [Coelomomyces lativittatus]|nr:hypothetical protein HMI56_002721 [Coelomomyces lativittatus]
MVTVNLKLFYFYFFNSHLPSVKASTHCSEDQCTWSCEINSKKVFQFQFPNPSTFTLEKLKTIKMYTGLANRFSCSAGFCCSRSKTLNFNSKDLTDSNRYDWIKEKESNKFHELPEFVEK